MINTDRNFIRVVDDVMTPEFCQQLIDRFEEQQRWSYRRDDAAHLTELPLWTDYHSRTANPSEALTNAGRYCWDAEVNNITPLVQSLAQDYLDRWTGDYMPPSYTIEGMRIKRYVEGESFATHIDVDQKEMSTRFVAFLFYLNNNSAGTYFTQEDLMVQARVGRVVIFPPLWTFPHMGLPVEQGSKYILSTYLHLP